MSLALSPNKDRAELIPKAVSSSTCPLEITEAPVKVSSLTFPGSTTALPLSSVSIIGAKNLVSTSVSGDTSVAVAASVVPSLGATGSACFFV